MSKKTPQTHRSLDDFPEVVAAQAKLDELRAERRDVEERIRKLDGQPMRSSAERSITAKARALLGIGTAQTDAPAVEDIADCRKRARILDEALHQGEQILQENIRRVSFEVCQDVADEHLALAEGVVTAIGGLQTALRREIEFRQRLQSGGIDTSSLVLPSLPGANGDLLRQLRHVNVRAAHDRLREFAKKRRQKARPQAVTN